MCRQTTPLFRVTWALPLDYHYGHLVQLSITNGYQRLLDSATNFATPLVPRR